VLVGVVAVYAIFSFRFRALGSVIGVDSVDSIYFMTVIHFSRSNISHSREINIYSFPFALDYSENENVLNVEDGEFIIQNLIDLQIRPALGGSRHPNIAATQYEYFVISLYGSRNDIFWQTGAEGGTSVSIHVGNVEHMDIFIKCSYEILERSYIVQQNNVNIWNTLIEMLDL